MSSAGLVVGLSVGAALAFAVSTNLKHASAAQLPPVPRVNPRSVGRFVLGMASHPLWLLGMLADGMGLALQVLALHVGALAVVQPLLVSGLIFSVVLRQFSAVRPRWSDLSWSAVLVAALVGFLFVAGTASGATSPHETPDRLPAVVAALAGLVVALVSIWVARRLQPAATSAALLGIAVGLIYAADAALLKSATDQAVRGPAALFGSWPIYAVVVVGGLGLLLCQLAYQAGPLTASQPTITAVDPLASVAIGVLVFDEHLRRGPWTGASLVVLVAVLALAVVRLGRSQVRDEVGAGADSVLSHSP
jgi:drug/metabolite transporter (DMT)-like permease